MACVIVTGLATEFIFGDASDERRAFLIESARLCFRDGKTCAVAIREERAGRLGFLFILIVHIREDLDGRLREMLATETTDPDDENGDQSVD
jgi:hypothetical protein